MSAVVLILVVLETAAAIILAIAAVSLLRQLRTKVSSNKLLIQRNVELEDQAAMSLQRAQQSSAVLDLHREWYHTLFGYVDGIVLVHGLDENGAPTPFVEVNSAACRILGYDRDTLLTKTIVDVQDAEVPVTAGFFSDIKVEDQIRKMAAKVVSNTLDKVLKVEHVTYEDFLRTSDGRKVPVRIDVHRCDLAWEPMIMWVARDVTELREGQRAVKESQRRLEDFFSYSPLGIAMFDADRRLITVNRAGLRMFGLPDPREFEHFNLFDNPFLPVGAKQTLGKAQSIHCEIVVDFEEVRKGALFASTRTGKGHYEVLISNLGCDNEYRPRGYFAQIQDMTQRRKVEADLRRIQTMDVRKDMPGGISGSFDDVPFTDIVQILCTGGKSMVLDITREAVSAKVYIHDGNVIHCVVGDQQGEEAFYGLMRWHGGSFTAEPCKTPPAPSIAAPIMSLLMEGARRFDEG